MILIQSVAADVASELGVRELGSVFVTRHSWQPFHDSIIVEVDLTPFKFLPVPFQMEVAEGVYWGDEP